MVAAECSAAIDLVSNETATQIMRIPFRRILIGKPIPTWHALQHRLPKILALPVFASDAMSSVAYATEEMLLVLALSGVAHLHYGVPITAVIIVLLWMVVTSYRRTVFAYPRGGGSYIVSKDNLGTIPGLTAASSILIDYTLTVAVSIAAGVDAIISAAPSLAPHRVELDVAFIFLIALANLRGVKESGALFAIPTYIFITSFVVMIGTGIFKALTGSLPPSPPPQIPIEHPFTLFLLLRAFSSGCTAMTGTEAVADGVAAFRPPEAKNAAATLVMMASVLGILFLGISWLSNHLGILPKEFIGGQQTVVSQIAEKIFSRNWFYFVIQGATMAILILAANTSFADFPRLSYFLARDRFMPRQFANIGDKLVFSNGIVVLAVLASTLVIAFGGVVSKLIPLYAVGVFLSFTLSQYGMVVHTRRLKKNGWWISLLGGTMTAIVTLVLAITKFAQGACIVVLLIPIMVIIFLRINQHYRQLADQLRLPEEATTELPEIKNSVIVIVPGIHKGILPALQYAKSLSPDCRAVYIEAEAEGTPLIEERWEKWGQGIPLVVLESPYRSIVQPLLKYLDEVKEEKARHIVTVIIPEFVPAKWWHGLLHNQMGIRLKIALLFRRDVILTNIRYYLEK